MTTADLERIRTLLAQCTPEQRKQLMLFLRHEFPVHALEQRWNIPAEVILEAIDRSSDLTQRGVRGVIAEAVFKQDIVNPLLRIGWADIPPTETDPSYDFVLRSPAGAQARIQVKMQRMREHAPLEANRAHRGMFRYSTGMWAVETQRTRGGTDSQGNSTRPYRFNEFDILAVCLHGSTNDWARFHYTVARWLIPDPKNAGNIFKYQPVAMTPNDDWTDCLESSVQWFHSNVQKTIRSTA